MFLRTKKKRNKRVFLVFFVFLNFKIVFKKGKKQLEFRKHTCQFFFKRKETKEGINVFYLVFRDLAVLLRLFIYV